MAAQQRCGGGARNNAFQIVEPLPEPERPWLDRCLTNQEQGWLVSRNSPDRTLGSIHLVRQTDPRQAYRINDAIQTRPLDHHGTGWGQVYFCMVLPRLAEGVKPRSEPR